MATTITMPNIEEELKKWTKEFKETQGAWQVILFNDPTSKYDDVVLWLQKSTGCSHQRAETITHTAHHTGKAVAYGGEKEKCQQVAGYLRGKGLQVQVDSAPR